MATWMKILVTGFSSFPGVPVNPCEEVLAWIAEDYSSTNVFTVILPVSYFHSIQLLVQDVLRYSPNFIIEFGVSNRTKIVKLETKAYNARHAKIPDIEGVLSNKEVIDKDLDYDLAQCTKWNVEQMCDALQDQLISHEVSVDPGRYVCNNLYWETMKRFPNIPTIFVHIPQITQENRSSLKQSVRAILDWTLVE